MILDFFRKWKWVKIWTDIKYELNYTTSILVYFAMWINFMHSAYLVMQLYLFFLGKYIHRKSPQKKSEKKIGPAQMGARSGLMPIFYLKIRVRQTCIFSLNIGISLSILWGAGCVGRAVGLFPHANKTQLNM